MRYEIPKKNFAELEEEVLKTWKSQKTFEKSLKNREGSPYFATYDGPPFATGLPHYGHLLAGTIKDVVLRYKTMKGFYVPRRFGWDCHGLPIENEIEKKLGLSGAAEIEAYGIDKFNQECEKNVLRYVDDWKEIVLRMGRWVDFNETYKTMDLPFMETVWWVFKQLWEKDLVYKGYRVMPVSAKLGTPISNFEAGENYRDVDDPSIFAYLPLVEEPETSLVIWTTTPWTLPSNLAAMVDPKSTYVKIRDVVRNRHVIVAKARLGALYKTEQEYRIETEMTGADLVGKRYIPLFDYFKDRDAFRVIAGVGVTMDDGTGIVHTAPGFGEADFDACKQAGIELVCPVTNNGLFTSEVPDFEGQFVKDTDKEIIKRLKESKRLHAQATIRHRYPYCWRSDTPLIYKAMETWFVRVEPMREALAKSNEPIHWTPGHLKEGRFGKWLAQARDWNIARNRYFGTPIPLWQADDGEILVVGSIEELEKLTGHEVHNLHRQYIDHIQIEKDGKLFKRIPETFDCWFESGSMPYAQNHYPFENKELVQATLPADFIAEGLDQTRAWFYTLTVISTALFDKPAFKNVIVNGIILAEDGTKMSKRLRNYPDPMKVVRKYGADAIRLYLIHSPAVRADDMRFSEKGVELVMRQILLPLWNAFSFLTTYARIYKWQPKDKPAEATLEIDRWLVSLTQKLIHDVELGMDDYDLSKAVDPFVDFVDELTNWYIRQNRRRFWEKEDEAVFATLHQALITIAQVAAPYIPFLSETLFQSLRLEGMAESVHLTDYPTYDASKRDVELEAEVAVVQRTVSMGHNLRKAQKLKVRQPLAGVYIASSTPKTLERLKRHTDIIASELNVKHVHLRSDEDEFVELTAKPNFRVLGKRVGKLMPQVKAEMAKFDRSQLDRLQRGEEVSVVVEGEKITLTSDEVEVVRQVRAGLEAANEGDVTVALETALTDELLLEGLARELVNKVATMRKEAGLDYVDRIGLKLKTNDRVRGAVEAHRETIAHEVLATKIEFTEVDGTEWDLNGEACVIVLEKEPS